MEEQATIFRAAKKRDTLLPPNQLSPDEIDLLSETAKETSRNEKEITMNRPEHSFSVTVDAAQGMCPSGEQWAETKMREGRIPVLACEGPCIRGDIARLVANLVAKEEPYARACYAEVVLVPQSAMARWAQQAEEIVMIDGCFLKCVGRILRNLVDDSKIVHIEALPYYMKYTEVFLMDDVPETERKETARQVADRILGKLRGTLEPAPGKVLVGAVSRSCGQRSSTAPSDMCPEKGGNQPNSQRTCCGE